MHFIPIGMGKLLKSPRLPQGSAAWKASPSSPCIDQELLRFVLDQVCHIGKSCTLFDPDDIWMFCQTKHGFGCHFRQPRAQGCYRL